MRKLGNDTRLLSGVEARRQYEVSARWLSGVEATTTRMLTLLISSLNVITL